MAEGAWVELPRDEHGFTEPGTLRLLYAERSASAFVKDLLQDRPALWVLAGEQGGLSESQELELSFRSTQDPDADPPSLDATLRIQKGKVAAAADGLGAYAGRVAVLLKRPGNPFPHMVTVGRARNCDVIMTLTTVSKVHAYFLQQGGRWALVDQRSTNGTFVNGRQVAAETPQPLNDGDLIRFGDKLTGRFFLASSLLEELRRRSLR